MTHNHDMHLEELLPSYALGVLEDGERRLVEEHLAEGCETCERELFELSGTLEDLAGSTAPVVPSDTVRARVLRSVAADGAPLVKPSPITAPEEPALQGGVSPGWRFAMAAGLALLIWSGWSQLQLHREVDRLATDRNGLRQELAIVRNDLSETRSELAKTLLAGRIVSAPLSRSVLLAGLEAAPDSSARTYVDPGTSRAVFYASNLQPLSNEETYQLWFIADGTPVSAGTFEVESDGSGTVLVEDVAAFDSLQAWAVTIEPVGGVPQPTGAMVLLGSVA